VEDLIRRRLGDLKHPPRRAVRPDRRLERVLDLEAADPERFARVPAALRRAAEDYRLAKADAEAEDRGAG
jgi:hypothetical protein